MNDKAIDALINAAEAVLDSDGGAMAMQELADALHALDPSRDYRPSEAERFIPEPVA